MRVPIMSMSLPFAVPVGTASRACTPLQQSHRRAATDTVFPEEAVGILGIILAEVIHDKFTCGIDARGSR